MNQPFDVVRAAEEVARTRWESRTAIAHRRAALLLRIIRQLMAFSEAAITVSMAAEIMGATDQEDTPVLIVAAMVSAALAQVRDALHLDQQGVMRLVELCCRYGEQRSTAHIRIRELGAAIHALAAEGER